MLPYIKKEEIRSDVRDVEIFEGVSLHVKILQHAKRSGRTALYIHGSGTVGNHTIVERPARWLIAEDVYDTMILPDRRGCGASSPWDHQPSLREQARDMEALLDALGVEKPVDALGISYGGPIALTLADVDARVQLVGLVSSSPTLGQIAWPWNWFVKLGILPAVMKRMYRREIGKAEPRYINYDFMYEWKEPTRQERWEHFKKVLRHTPADRLDSVIYEFSATLDPANIEVPEDVRLEIPVLQIIGTEDETWGSELPGRYRQRFPNLRRRLIEGADHGDALTRGLAFHQALKEMIAEVRAETAKQPTRA
ncbi:MAG: alpha/beta fold hydrolase [Anaerolineae bacterium]